MRIRLRVLTLAPGFTCTGLAAASEAYGWLVTGWLAPAPDDRAYQLCHQASGRVRILRRSRLHAVRTSSRRR
jgi:hypothetical protein